MCIEVSVVEWKCNSRRISVSTFTQLSNYTTMVSFLPKGFYIPQRWIMIMMGFFALFNSFALRSLLSIAITKMAGPLNRTEEILVDICPPYDNEVSTNFTTPVILGRIFEWSEYTQGIILSSFYWGYFLTQIPGGLLAEKYGSKYILGFSSLLMAILTVITPVATEWGGANILISIRFLMGLADGVVLPALSNLVSQWIPANERAFMLSIVHSGVEAGVAVSFAISGLILDGSSEDWPLIFYCFGGIGILWFPLWMLLCYSNPRQHPFITEKEKIYLKEQLENHTHENPPPFPWKHALTSKAFIAYVIIDSGTDLCYYLITTDLPKYMINVLRLPVLIGGYVLSANQVIGLVSNLVTSWFSDWSVAKGYVSVTHIRKITNSVGCFGAGALLLAAVYVKCNVIWSVFLITTGILFTGILLPGIVVNPFDLSPNYAGTLTGIGECVGSLTGSLAPYMVGVLTPNQTFTEWQLVFWIAFAIYVITTINFIIFGSGKVQHWNEPECLRDGAPNKQSYRTFLGSTVHFQGREECSIRNSAADESKL